MAMGLVIAMYLQVVNVDEITDVYLLNINTGEEAYGDVCMIQIPPCFLLQGLTLQLEYIQLMMCFL